MKKQIWCGPHAAGVLTGVGPEAADAALEKIQGEPVVYTHMPALLECFRALGWEVTEFINLMHEDVTMAEDFVYGRDSVYVVSCGNARILSSRVFGEHLANQEVTHAVAVNRYGMTNDSMSPRWTPLKNSWWANSKVTHRIDVERKSDEIYAN